jgi:hypothetical protein
MPTGLRRHELAWKAYNWVGTPTSTAAIAAEIVVAPWGSLPRRHRRPSLRRLPRNGERLLGLMGDWTGEKRPRRDASNGFGSMAIPKGAPFGITFPGLTVPNLAGGLLQSLRFSDQPGDR